MLITILRDCLSLRQKRENISRVSMPIKNQIVQASGETKMEFGVRLPIANPQTLWVLKGTRK